MAVSVRLFEEASHAAAYSKFRPVHPKEVYDKIINFTTKNNVSLDLVVDIGCGSGQSTCHLAPFCNQVIGTDISQAQIDCAKAQLSNHPGNVSFQVASADKLPFEDKSLSMVTCGEAWHWLDWNVVNPEIMRILKRPGVVAIYGYLLPLINNDKCRSLVLDFYSNTLQGYWHENCKYLDDYYRSVSLPLPLSSREDFEVPSSNTLEGFVSYVETWSGYQAYLKAHPNTTVLSELKGKLKDVLLQSDGKNEDPVLPIVTPYFLLLCLNE